MFYLLGEPQEECIRCGKMYVLSSELNNSKGVCGKCLGITTRDSMKSEALRSSGESGTEEEEMEEEEELSNGGIEFSDKKLCAT